ncbi:MAG: SprT-like domain-containing protein [Verrucomicrobiota bacterium]|jgi:SprT protein|nr:SprT-like domain-containing protein [Verrucomicrobiota bacterium]|tara:strand:+ start:355 stop:924 length:570 start_codon:yes stop_codon:yes gene_type:complete
MLKEVGRKLRFAYHVGNLFYFRMQNASGSIENLARQKVAELCAKAREFYGVEIDPDISFDLRGMAAGQANYRENKIRLNRELLEKYENDFIEQTVPHEYAHLVAYQKFGGRIRPHGKEWRSVMQALGAEPRRTHNYQVSPARTCRRFLYQCNCPGKDYQLTSIRHNRIKRGSHYFCSKCKGPLIFVEGK